MRRSTFAATPLTLLMIHRPLRSWLPLVPLAMAAPSSVADAQAAVEMAQLTIRQRVIIRVPRVGPAPLPVGRTAIAPPVAYRESKGPKCVAANAMAGAAIGAVNVVDLVMQGGARVRAQLDGDCAPLDFYSGFYLKGSPDGMVCAGRDSIRVRSGASCPIKRFRTLKVKR